MKLYQERISADPRIMLGKPCVKGTRLTVALLLDILGEGIDPGELLEMYPRLTMLDIQAVIQYAAAVISEEDDLLPQAA